ncbi:hypothetical protein BG000_008613 [Podila horticola]|nr:hypothetical protein BG000_008613 [Podila horticola]
MSGNYTPGTSTPRRSGTSSASSSPPGTPPSGLRSHYLNAAFQRSQHQFYSMGSAPGSTTSFHQTPQQTPQQTSQRPNISILVPPTTARIQIPEPAANQRSYSADHLRVDEPEITITSPGGSNSTEHHATTLQRALSNLIEKENRVEEVDENENEEDGPIVMKNSKTSSGSSSSTPPGTPQYKKKGMTKFPKVVVDRLDPEKAALATAGTNHTLSQSRNSMAGTSDTTLAELNEKAEAETLMAEKKQTNTITISAPPVPTRAPADLTRQPSKAGVLSNLLKLQGIGRQHKASSSKSRKEKKQKRPAMYSRSSNNSTSSLTKKSVFGTYPPLPATTPTQSTFAPGTMTNFHPSTSRSNSSGNIYSNNHRNSIQFDTYFGALSATPSPMHSPTMSPRGSFSGGEMLPGAPLTTSAGGLSGEEQLRITMAVADILERQDYILRLAKSMIKYGAPSHRLEDAIDYSARHLELNLQCVYLPNVMIVAFTDYETHTSETHLLKIAADLDMYKCALVHQVHKMVTHESMPVEEAIMKLEAINSEKDTNPRWATILAYATAGFCTAPMFFNGSWVDAGVGFLLGGAVGLMVWLAEKVPSYARICEITMSVVVAFVAEALHGYVDCGTAIKMAGIVIILPGYTITCSILELSSRHIISGSVRLFYAVVFSLLLGYGLSIGASLWHLFDPSSNANAASSTACTPSLDPKWNIMFVPLFAISLNIWLKAHPRQWILATILSIVGYAVSYTSSVYGGASAEDTSTEVSSALAAFAIGFCGNVYQRMTRQLSFQAVVCAVFFLVPGSIGLKGAIAWFSDDISTGVNFALQMVATAIAISVGLFASALVVYPMGKSRSAQMTF